MRALVTAVVLGSLTAGVFLGGCAAGLAGRGIEDGSDLGLPGEAAVELTFDGAWSWFAAPRAVSYAGEHERTYVTWVNSVGDLRVASYDHSTRRRQVSVVREEFQIDDRANPALLVLPDGRLMVFYSGHRGHWLAFQTSLRPEDVTEWTRASAVGQYADTFHGYSHPNPVQLAGEDGRIYVFWRGEGYRPHFTRSSDRVNWDAPQNLVECESEEPYLMVAGDGDRTIHMALTDGNPNGTPDNSVYYVCYRDEAFWRADGTRIRGIDALPLRLSELDVVYDAGKQGAPGWVWDVAADADGRPVVAYAAFPAKDDHRYRYAAWDGVSWVDSEITPGGSWFAQTPTGIIEEQPYYSGGIVLDTSDPSFAYLSRPVDGVFEIERWRTDDLGRSWRTDLVTSGSSADNTRPCVPAGRLQHGPEVLWMHGEYTNIRTFDTSIRMR